MMIKKGIFVFVFVLILGVILFLVIPQNKAVNKIQKLENEIESKSLENLNSLDLKLNLEAKIELCDTIDLTFNVGGKLEAGEIKMQSQTLFKKNQLLFQINNKTAYTQYLFSKEQLIIDSEELTKILEKLILPSELVKWQDFIALLKENQLIPDFPVIKDLEEQKVVENSNLLKKYQSVKKLESHMSYFFYLAPFDGKVLDVKAKVGTLVHESQTVAKLISTEKKVLKVEIDSADYANIASVQKVDVNIGNSLINLEWNKKSIIRKGHKINLIFSGKTWRRFDDGKVGKLTLVGLAKSK